MAEKEKKTFSGLNRWTDKQLQIHFSREDVGNGKYKTRIKLAPGEKKYSSRRGLIHRTVNLKYRVQGDVPSVSRSLKSIRPETIKGHIVKGALLTTWYAGSSALKAIETTALSSETAVQKTAHGAVNAAKERLREKYHQEAVDDGNRAVIFTAGTVNDAVRGTVNHLKGKKRYKSEKLKLKSLNTDISELKIRYRKSPSPEQKKELKLLKKSKKAQKKIVRNTKQAPAVIKPAGYAGRQLKQKAVSKAVYEDDENDMIRAAYSIKRHGTDHIADYVSKHSGLKRAEKKYERIQNRQKKYKSKLRDKESRLKNKSSTKKKQKKTVKKKPVSSSSKSLLSRAGSSMLDVLRSFSAHSSWEAAATVLGISIPVVLILSILFFIIMMFISFLSGSGFILGTYNAQDYALSQAEAYYTKLSWEMNENIILLGTDDWKKGLKNLGADTKNMKDKPDIRQWGHSSEFDFDLAYDFDKYKLWSFLCAYYYDFSESAENGDINYWKYDSSTSDVLDKLFRSEYSFRYKYNSDSHWETRNSYIFSGGIDETYWLADSTQVYRDCFYPVSAPSEIHDFTDGNGFVHFDSNLEVLNAKDENSRTGWYIQDQRYIVGDGSGQQSNPFYSWFYDSEFGRLYYEEYHKRSPWGWGDDQCYWLVSPDDSHRWNSSLDNRCLVNYYKANDWVKDCSLYYNVEKHKSFEEAILEILGNMADSSERTAYYRLLSGSDDSDSYYGNHQTLGNVLAGDSIRNYTVMNGYGYYMTEWNSRHCSSDSNHEGLDVFCNSGSEIYSPFDCKIDSYSNGTVVLRKNDVRYWYDGNKGKNRDTEVTVGNVKLKDGLKKGDTVKKGDVIAYVTDSRKCEGKDNSGYGTYIHIKTEIDTDGIGWHYVDPQLILY